MSTEIAYSTAPFVTAVVVDALLCMFPVFLARRIATVWMDDSASKIPRYILYLMMGYIVTLIATQSLLVCVFGLGYWHENDIFAILSTVPIMFVAELAQEVARLLLIGVVLMRVGDLVVPAVSEHIDKRLIAIYAVVALRLVYPLVVVAGGAHMSLFTAYAARMLEFDVFVFAFATVLVVMHCHNVERYDTVSHISRTVLYSNASTSVTLGLIALVFAVVVGVSGASQGAILNQLPVRVGPTVSIYPNQVALNIIPSLYNFICGFMVTFFLWDVKALIQNREQVGTKGGGIRKVKFSLNSIL